MIRKTITLPAELAAELDAWVTAGAAPNLSRLLQQAAAEHVARLRRQRLATEAAKLDPSEETALAQRSSPPAAPWHRVR